MITCALEGEPDDAVFVVVGTAFARPDEPEPTSGRLLCFELSGRALDLRAETRTKGAVYALEPFGGKLLAGVRARCMHACMHACEGR